MVTLDLRNIGELFIKTLVNKPWPFELTGGVTCPVLTGATASFIISQAATIQTLAVGAGLTITAANRIAVNAAPLAEGVYNYTFEITPVIGAVIRIANQIQVY